MEEYKFPSEPLANPKSIVTGPQYRFTVLDSRVLRYEWAEDGTFEDRPSTFALFRHFPKPEFRVVDKAGQLEIITPSFHVTYDKKRFTPNGLIATVSTKSIGWETEWRFGEGRDENNLGGTARTLDEVDGRCDMGTGVISKAGYASLDDTNSMLFNDHGFVSPRRPGDRVDGYLFSYGRDYKGAMELFYAISGRQPTVPRWCLGNWWSRYYAYSQAEYLDLMKKFKENDIPLSVAVIDMDWHWVKQDFVPHSGWTGYSWNTDLFPSPTAFTDALHQMNLKTTLNDHPSAGIYHHEDVYKELARVLGHDTTHGDPILFDPTSPAFMHAFFNIVHRKLEEQGCDFWWIDWQQGTQSSVPGFDPLWLLNHFQFLDTKRSQPDSLPLLFSRYAGPGSHRYPVGFSGDSFATWASLQFQPEFTATASNIGFGWWSHDLGGHLHGSRDDECTARWVQYGVFSPILRLHSTKSPWMSKEAWLYRSESMLAIQGAMQLRHRLVPYIYSINAAASTSLPLVQPLYWNFPLREESYRFPNQYYFGPSLVVSPIVVPRDPRTNLAAVKMWIAPGRHVDMFTGTVYDGDREITVHRPLHQIPVLLPEGSMLPLDSEVVPSNGCANPTALEILVIVGKDGHFELLEDARDDRERKTGSAPTKRSISMVYNQAAGRLSCEGGNKAWSFRFLSAGIDPSAIEVFVNGWLFAQAEVKTDAVSGHSDTVVTIPAALDATDKILIELGPNPQLTVLDHTESLRQSLNDFQIAFEEKDRIWEVLQSSQNTTIKLSRLLSLDVEEAICNPIAELLLADSRSNV